MLRYAVEEACKKTRFNFSKYPDEGEGQLDALYIAVSEVFSKTRCRGRGVGFLSMGDSTLLV